MIKQKLLFIGAGYVGLVNAACFSKFGHNVLCYDIDKEKIAELNKGKVKIFEEGLTELIEEQKSLEKLKFIDELTYEEIADRIIFIAVGTPSKKDSYETDLTYVESAIKTICNLLGTHDKKIIFVIKSTVPVGTADNIKNFIKNYNTMLEFEVISNPEFLREGIAVYDCLNPDRVIIGGESVKTKEQIKNLHTLLVEKNVPFVLTDNKTAELAKYASNSFLAAKIAFINEMADLCAKTNASILDLQDAMGLDHRINKYHLNPGPGFGGSCFPKDLRSLSFIGQQQNSELHLVNSTIKSNESTKKNMALKIKKICGNDINNKIITILGITFKANTNDIRETPALDIINYLQKMGAQVNIYDPKLNEKEYEIFKGTRYFSDISQSVLNSSAIVLLAGHKEFEYINFSQLIINMKETNLIDLRNFYKDDYVQNLRKLGINYYNLNN